MKIKASLMLLAIGIIMMVLGFTFGSASGDSDSGWYMMAMVGMFPLMGAGYIWLFSIKDNSQKEKYDEDDDF